MKHIVLAIFVVALHGCVHNADNSVKEKARSTVAHEQHELILSIEEMPKKAFLDRVDKNAILSDTEKTLIISELSPDGYSHCKLVKYKRDGKMFMDIDQYYPLKEIGKDSKGHTLIEGGSGTQSNYQYENGQWSSIGVTHYD